MIGSRGGKQYTQDLERGERAQRDEEKQKEEKPFFISLFPVFVLHKGYLFEEEKMKKFEESGGMKDSSVGVDFHFQLGIRQASPLQL